MKILSSDRRRGFSLLECGVLVLVMSMIGMTVMPMLGVARHQARGMSSAQKLMSIGQGGMMYAADNQERLFTYTWRAGETYVLPDGRPKTASSDQQAGANQNQEILLRRTGRISGMHKIQNFSARLPHRRYTHLVLMDYLDEPFGSDLFIDPSDDKQQVWKDNPLEYDPGSSVPYVNGIPDGYDNDTNWPTRPVRSRWAFASSFQVVPSAWNSDTIGNRYYPVSASPHLFGGSTSLDLPAGRRLSEVVYNSNKVWMFEEFDRDRARQLYFAYDEAMTEKLMFDGSVNNWASGDANPSIVPEYGMFHWRQIYVPLDRFPIPEGGLGDPTLLSQRFRWTFRGLAGVDYGPVLAPGDRRGVLNP